MYKERNGRLIFRYWTPCQLTSNCCVRPFLSKDICKTSVSSCRIHNKMLSYRRKTALQGALVLAKSGRLELGDDILRILKVYLQPLWRVYHAYNRPTKLSNSAEKT